MKLATCLTGAVTIGFSASARVFRYADAMRRRRISLILLVLAIAILGVAGYVGREPLRRQWTLYRIGAAASAQEAEPLLVRCETGGDRDAMIAELVRKWGTGNRQFDLYLAGHLGGASCGERLRAGLRRRTGPPRRTARTLGTVLDLARPLVARRTTRLRHGLLRRALDGRAAPRHHLARGARLAGPFPTDRLRRSGPRPLAGGLAGPLPSVA